MSEAWQETIGNKPEPSFKKSNSYQYSKKIKEEQREKELKAYWLTLPKDIQKALNELEVSRK